MLIPRQKQTILRIPKILVITELQLAIMYSTGRLTPDMIKSWRKIKEDLQEKIKANRDEVEIFRFQIEELNWLINEGSNLRTQEEIESEYNRLAKEKQTAVGTQRLRLEAHYSILVRSVPFLALLRAQHKQMMDQSRGLAERVERFKAKLKDPELLEESEVSEVEIKAQSNRVIRMMLAFPAERKPKLPAIIVVHDRSGVTNHIRSVGRRLAAAGYVAAIPILELDRDASWEKLQQPADDLVSVLDYLRGSPEIDKYLIGCLGFGVGGTCSLILATKSQYLRACFTICSEVPPLQTLQTDELRAAVSFVQLADDHPSVDNYNSLREDWWKAVRTARGRMGFGAILEGVRRGFFDEDSPEFDKEKAMNTWSNIILFFDKELLADRSRLPDDQVGIQFSKLSSTEKEQYLAKMRADPLFAKEVVRGFYAFVQGQLDEDKKTFSSFGNANPKLMRERGRIAAANFPSYSENQKKMFLEEARNNEYFALGFVGNSSVPLSDDPDRPNLAPEYRKAIFDLALSSQKYMRAFGQSRGAQFVYLLPRDRKQTLDLIAAVESAEIADGRLERIENDALRHEFCIGFGEGLSFHVLDLKAQDLVAIRGFINECSEFVEGLKNNLNWSLGQMSEKDKEKLLKQFAWMPRFARGLGISFGLGFSKVPIEIRKPFLDFMEKSEYFFEGCGYGFGLIESKLNKSETDLAQSLFRNDEHFKRGCEEARAV